MRPESHARKARILLTSLARLDRECDYELRLELLMLVTTHSLNSILHLMEQSSPKVDQIHIQMPERVYPADPALLELVEALGELEELRALVVRGDARGRIDVEKFDTLPARFAEYIRQHCS